MTDGPRPLNFCIVFEINQNFYCKFLIFLLRNAHTVVQEAPSVGDPVDTGQIECSEQGSIDEPRCRSIESINNIKFTFHGDYGSCVVP